MLFRSPTLAELHAQITKEEIKLGRQCLSELEAGLVVPDPVLVALVVLETERFAVELRAATADPPEELPTKRGYVALEEAAEAGKKGGKGGGKKDAKAAAKPKKGETTYEPVEPTKGFVLDGFPRTVVQAKLLEKAFTGLDPDALAALRAQASTMYPPHDPRAGLLPASAFRSFLDGMLVLADVDAEQATARAVGRRVDEETGRVFHVDDCPPPTTEPGLIERLSAPLDPDHAADQISVRTAAYRTHWDGHPTTALRGWLASFPGLVRPVVATSTVADALAEGLAEVARVQDAAACAAELQAAAASVAESLQAVEAARAAAEAAAEATAKASEQLFAAQKAEVEAKVLIDGDPKAKVKPAEGDVKAAQELIAKNAAAACAAALAAAQQAATEAQSCATEAQAQAAQAEARVALMSGPEGEAAAEAWVAEQAADPKNKKKPAKPKKGEVVPVVAARVQASVDAKEKAVAASEEVQTLLAKATEAAARAAEQAATAARVAKEARLAAGMEEEKEEGAEEDGEAAEGEEEAKKTTEADGEEEEEEEEEEEASTSATASSAMSVEGATSLVKVAKAAEEAWMTDVAQIFARRRRLMADLIQYVVGKRADFSAGLHADLPNSMELAEEARQEVVNTVALAVTQPTARFTAQTAIEKLRDAMFDAIDAKAKDMDAKRKANVAEPVLTNMTNDMMATFVDLLSLEAQRVADGVRLCRLACGTAWGARGEAVAPPVVPREGVPVAAELTAAIKTLVLTDVLPDGLDKTQPLLATAAKNALAMAAVCSASTAVHWKDEGGGGEGETEEETAAFAHKAQQASEDAARLIGELAQASRDRVAFVVKHALAATAAVMETGQRTWQSLEAWGKGRVADECAAVSRACALLDAAALGTMPVPESVSLRGPSFHAAVLQSAGVLTVAAECAAQGHGDVLTARDLLHVVTRVCSSSSSSSLESSSSSPPWVQEALPQDLEVLLARGPGPLVSDGEVDLAHVLVSLLFRSFPVANTADVDLLTATAQSLTALDTDADGCLDREAFLSSTLFFELAPEALSQLIDTSRGAKKPSKVSVPKKSTRKLNDAQKTAIAAAGEAMAAAASPTLKETLFELLARPLPTSSAAAEKKKDDDQKEQEQEQEQEQEEAGEARATTREAEEVPPLKGLPIVRLLLRLCVDADPETVYRKAFTVVCGAGQEQAGVEAIATMVSGTPGDAKGAAWAEAWMGRLVAMEEEAARAAKAAARAEAIAAAEAAGEEPPEEEEEEEEEEGREAKAPRLVSLAEVTSGEGGLWEELRGALTWLVLPTVEEIAEEEEEGVGGG